MGKMISIQIRFPPDELKRIDGYVALGEYSSRSDFVRDAVRRMEMIRALEKMNEIMQKSGVTFDDLLSGSGDIRASLFKEMFGDMD
jgi:Arc/MetJ-type ribon-helix-helix transcriptional regulator